MGTAVPLDRLGVAFEEFAAMIDDAVRQYHAAQDDRYLAAVLATLTWIAGMTDNDPLTGQHCPATLDAQSNVRVAAPAIMHDVQDPIYGLTNRTIHHEWATGITRTLEWNLGPDVPPAADSNWRRWDGYVVRPGRLRSAGDCTSWWPGRRECRL